jgi:hypothetical protein
VYRFEFWVYLHSINPKQVSTFGYRTSQFNMTTVIVFISYLF